MGIWKALAVVATLAAIAVAFIFWAGSAHSPDLSAAMAAKPISAAPQLEQRGRLVAVVRTERGHDSLNTCCYTAELSIQQNGTADAIPARADFRFYQKQWHLNRISWGDPPNVTIVRVEE
jgi:hypothetical protein